MRGRGRRNRVDQVTGRIDLAVALLDPVTEYSTDLATYTVSSKACPAAIDPFKNSQNFRRVDLGDGSLAKPRKDVLLKFAPIVVCPEKSSTYERSPQ